jgi:hypothetical protein
MRFVVHYPRFKIIEFWITRIAHRLAGHGAIGYCPVCRLAIYTTFTQHWDEVKH